MSGGIFLVADATSLYWSTDRAGAGPDVLLQMSLQGGNIITLASGLTCPCEIAAYECDVYWTESGDGSNGTVSKVPSGGGTATMLASGLAPPAAVAVDARGVYFAEYSALVKMPRGGGAVTTLATIETDFGADAIALDTTSVYWSDVRGVLKLTPR